MSRNVLVLFGVCKTRVLKAGRIPVVVSLLSSPVVVVETNNFVFATATESELLISAFPPVVILVLKFPSPVFSSPHGLLRGNILPLPYKN
jgi:hypothetical protein